MDPRIKEISDRLAAMVQSRHPLTNFVLTFFKTMLNEWKEPARGGTPPPFGDSPLFELVESMLPTVEGQDRDSATIIRCLLDKARISHDPVERRTLGQALEWFYLYFTRKTDIEFEAWLDLRSREPSH